MANEGYVGVELCKVVHKNVEEKLEGIATEVKEQRAEIKELTRISDQLVQLLKIQSELQEKTIGRVDGLEKAEAQTSSVVTQKPKETTFQKFMQTKSFDRIVTTCIIIVLLIVIGAIGQNYLEDIKPLIK